MTKENRWNNPIRGPINSWIFNVLDGYMHWLFGNSKRELFKDHPYIVVEIGAGTGTNMRYYKKGTKLIAIEPNIHMHSNLQKRADKYGINLSIRTSSIEAVTLPSNSISFIVSTLVLCSVENPKQCIAKIKDLLIPGGEFVFIEHIKANKRGILSLIQNLVHKPWHWFFEGCHTNRDTKQLLKLAGFSKLELETYNLYSPFIPIIPQIRGRAIK